MNAMRLMSGYILNSESKQPLQREGLGAPSFEFVRSLSGTRWDEFSYRCRTPLRGEEQPDLHNEYRYELLVRRSGGRMFLVGETRGVVQHVLEHVINSQLRLGMRPLEINIDGLVRLVANTPEQYVLSFVHARMSSSTNDLKAMSFYGDDIGESKFFRDQLATLQPYACGLRDVVARTEIARLRRDGVISFQYKGGSRIREIERVLHYVSSHSILRDRSSDV